MIRLYERTSIDYTGNGLAVLTPTECTTTEEAGGQWEVSCTVPVTDDLKSRLLERGRVLKVPVPAMTTPALEVIPQESGTTTKGLAIYAPKATTKAKGKPVNVWSGKGTYTSIEKLWSGDNVILLEAIDTSGEGAKWMHICTPSGTEGWGLVSSFTYVSDIPQGTSTEVIRETIPAHQVKDQLFRIYDVEEAEDGSTVTAKARHISYDLLYNTVVSYDSGVTDPQTALNGLMAQGENGSMGFTLVTNLTDKIEITADKQNIIDVLLGDKSALIKTAQAQVIRDNYTIYLLKNDLRYRGVTIRYGKNLLGVSRTVNDEAVYTRLIPVGQTKDGNPLLMDERYLDSDQVDVYPYPRCKVWQVSGAKVGSKRKMDDGTEIELDAQGVKDWLREEAQTLLDDGCDLATAEFTVSFQDLGQTEEYEEYKNLQQVFLYDTVTIDHAPRSIHTTAQVIGYTYDCLAERYTEISLGDAFSTTTAVTSGTSIASGTVTAGKLAAGSVDTANIRDMAITTAQILNASITSAKIADAAITAAKIENASIDTAKIADAAITSAKIGDAEITSAKIADAAITTAKIEDLAVTVAKIKDFSAQVATIVTAEIKNAKIDAAQIENLSAQVADIVVANIGTMDVKWADIATLTAAVADIATAKIGAADISFAQIKDLSADKALITQGTAGKYYIADLAVTDANMVSLTVGDLVVRGADGKYWRVKVDSTGNVTASETLVSGTNIEDSSVSGDKLVENTITAREINADEIFAKSATVNELIAKNMNASTFFAQEATLNALKTAKITGSQTLQLMAGEIDTIESVFVVDSTGTHVKAINGHAEVATTPEGIEMFDEKGTITTSIKNGEMNTQIVKTDKLNVGGLVTRAVADGIVAEMWED